VMCNVEDVDAAIAIHPSESYEGFRDRTLEVLLRRLVIRAIRAFWSASEIAVQ
jgi:hypothetical protein